MVLDAAGIDKIVFGSGAPNQYIGVNVLKLNYLKLTNDMCECDIEKIASGNLLGLVK